jgi:2-polyprenyl-3-methyl-5-hydroxy-6-metoxy-1,4-benzoquinol methylase
VQLLYASSQAELATAGNPFEIHVEPLLRLLDAAARSGHDVAKSRLGQDYLSVCRWPFRRLEYSFVLAAVAKNRTEHGMALDAGSGITPFGHALAGLGYCVVACDADADLMNALARAGMEKIYGTSVGYEAQDLTRLSYPDATFDLITCVSVLEHIGAPHDQAAVKEMLRVLKPGGQLLMTVDYEPPSVSTLGGRYGRRAWDYARHGDVIGIVKGAVRKVRGRQASQGLARNARTANQPFGPAHLAEDILPLFRSAHHAPDVVVAPSESIRPDEVAAFWNLVPGLFEQNNRRIVLPVGLSYLKP